MDITSLPFGKLLIVAPKPEEGLVLDLQFIPDMDNHIDTFHASARLSLAESCSGIVLQNQFTELEGASVPVVRKAETKF